MAAGFASVRTFNETSSRCSPCLRATARSRRPPAARRWLQGRCRSRLPFRAPLCPDNLFGHLVATGVPGVEEWSDGAYRRTLRLPHGHGIVGLRPTPDHIGLPAAAHRPAGPVHRHQPMPTSARSRRRPRRRRRPAARRSGVGPPGRQGPRTAGPPYRRPGRARHPRRHRPAGVDRRRLGPTPLGWSPSLAPPSTTSGGLTHLFPEASDLADADPEALAMPESRRAALLGLARALTDGRIDLDAGTDWHEARAQLGALPGLGPWTVETIAMRGLGDPDAFPVTDLGVRGAAGALGLPGRPAALVARAAAWRPWRAYATQYLWATGDHPINQMPAPDGHVSATPLTKRPRPRRPDDDRTYSHRDGQSRWSADPGGLRWCTVRPLHARTAPPTGCRDLRHRQQWRCLN